MIKFSFVTFAFMLLSGTAYAENPYVGMPEDMAAQDRAFRETHLTDTSNVDRCTAGSQSCESYTDGSANRFGDASPSSRNNWRQPSEDTKNVKNTSTTY